MRTFVDNVVRQAIERHLLNPLPQSFWLEEVVAMNDDELQDIAAESFEDIALRKNLRNIHENLQRCVLDPRK